jgi:hypothetical protein
LDVPLFLKILSVLSIILLQIMLSIRKSYSKKIFLSLFSLGLCVVIFLGAYYFLIRSLLSYNQTVCNSLTQITR